MWSLFHTGGAQVRKSEKTTNIQIHTRFSGYFHDFWAIFGMLSAIVWSHFRPLWDFFEQSCQGVLFEKMSAVAEGPRISS